MELRLSNQFLPNSEVFYSLQEMIFSQHPQAKLPPFFDNAIRLNDIAEF